MRALILILFAAAGGAIGYHIEKDATTIFQQMYACICYLGAAVLFAGGLVCDQIVDSQKAASRDLSLTLRKLAAQQAGSRGAERLDQVR